jgi:hypothetical protein
MLITPSIPLPPSFVLNAWNKWAAPINTPQNPMNIVKNERINKVLNSGYRRMIIPARMLTIDKKIFNPMLDLSTARLPRVKKPPTSQYAPMNVIRIRMVIPGVVRNMNPTIKESNPHRSTTHHGKRFVKLIIASGTSVVSVMIIYMFRLPWNFLYYLQDSPEISPDTMRRMKEEIKIRYSLHF